MLRVGPEALIPEEESDEEVRRNRRLCRSSARAGRVRQRQQQRQQLADGRPTRGYSSGGGKTIAFLLPETKTARYESQDRPLFEEKVKELCPDCKILYSNADQDAAKQQQQAEAALTQGAKVMVLDPVDGAAAAAIVNQANAKNVPVISYDRLLLNSKPDYYVEFDSPSVGKLQGQALVDKLKADGKKGSIVMINGAPTDNNAKLFKQGAHSRHRHERRQGRQGVRHARLDAGQGPDRDGAGDHRARQERLRRRLRRQRRHRRRRDRGDEGRRHRPDDRPDHRPGRRAGRRSSGSSPASST